VHALSAVQGSALSQIVNTASVSAAFEIACVMPGLVATKV